ncbi:hypothetical protein R3P38DRAFT_2907496 [Favolaschia claudopus]|uniref:BRCT domain-containing protein n=1 Tax=Favolaschia claudopus TaxID=2862362 RepID=A0AAV9Z2N9_9AGAR
MTGKRRARKENAISELGSALHPPRILGQRDVNVTVGTPELVETSVQWPQGTNKKILRAPSSSLQTLASALEKLHTSKQAVQTTRAPVGVDLLGASLDVSALTIAPEDVADLTTVPTGRVALVANTLALTVTSEPKQITVLRRSSRPACKRVSSKHTLTVLQHCFVYVDVRYDSAESLITEILTNLGAKVARSVCPSLTHIVFKDGLQKTLHKYNALPEPKPVVVGMEWVVKSAETLVRQKELYYIIDPDNMNATKPVRDRAVAVDAEPRVNSTLFSFGALPPYKMAQLRKTSMNA